jgi:hypothetical protein
MERQKPVKRRTRMNKAQSTVVCRVFAEKEGEWEEIMGDERVERMGYSKEFLRTHINNKKKRLRNTPLVEESSSLSGDGYEDEEEPSLHKRRRDGMIELERRVTAMEETLNEIRELLRADEVK